MRHRLLLALALSTAAPALAQVHQYGGLAISAGGDRLATIEGPGGLRGHAAITIRRASDGAVQRQIDPCAKCGYAGLIFGPAGELAFVAREPGAATAQLIVADANGATHTLATIPGLASTPRFSPDGKRIALLVTLGAAKETGATQAGVRQIGEIGEKSDEQRLAVFPVAGATTVVTPISPADRFVYEYDWLPDGTGFVVTSAPGNGDNNWWVATLDAVDATTGAVRNITRPATQLNFPRVSPDGRTVAYIGGLMSDNGSVGGDIWTVPVTGGAPTDITAGQPVTYLSLDWTAGGLRAVSLRDDRMEIGAIEPGRAPARPYYSEAVSLGAGEGRAAFSADGRSAATVAQSFTVAPAIHAGPLAALKPVTRDNAAATPVVSARSITWKSDQYNAQGWLLGPATPPAGKAPMIVNVHGGPSAASTPRFVEHGPASELMDQGYYVFLPNPRGSYGQGEAFTAANKRDFGGGDLRDVLAGVDAAEKAAPIDDARLGLTGCSYGGFMAMWANTQTNRFKAIVAGAGLSNWISYYGTNGIDQWMIPFTGKSAYEDHKVYEDMSAVYHVAKARTPTFIYVGERDIEVPPTQSIEWWHALRNQGVEASLVIYPDAGHCVSRPDQAADVRARQLAWFNKYLAK
ncbi:S9 family peptidase [Sphingomonas bacterium]|uniref:S9 family peptidase n=1 Tax=Sphingomonas bacterium TaxID=1895847 RepID=UPI0015772E9B|nr:S9 family peptidase [Sphingomonas bacterium]